MALRTGGLRYGTAVAPRVPDMVRWGPVIAAVVIGLGFFALVTTMWLAIAYSAGTDGWVSRNITWFAGATAAASLLLAGVIAGALAGVRGTAAGLANGVTAWALLFILSLTAIIPGALNLIGALGAGIQEGNTSMPGTAGGGAIFESALWTGFWALLVGLVLAAVGGVLGGKLRRPVDSPQEPAGDHGPPEERRGEVPLSERQISEVDRAQERR